MVGLMSIEAMNSRELTRAMMGIVSLHVVSRFQYLMGLACSSVC